ncbi:hypothetical protein BBK82_01660 [Lentzea guizhouensis]|uniref:DUF4192 domain-containing protein n=1 Tax=Lentzea guizhouensis TaxID=1586287 RepID=A0A1B2HB73_9PSEU|nr:DUF4192 domain-containing protein [Lentzea guizhouensis]ANZ34971.1 hypothetical protein BBK82_01660 [Lentzea guizhouensis]
MPTTLPKPIRLRAAGDLYAAIPHLMGFHPTESLVVLVLRDGAVSMTMRVDLPRPRHRGLLAAQLEIPLLEQDAEGVILAVICPPSEHIPEDLPHEPLITALANRLGGHGIDVVEAVWLRACEKDVPWFCYFDLDCHGTLPDPQTSAVAAACASDGNVTFESRAAMAALVTLDSVEARERRSVLLDELMNTAEPPVPGVEFRRVRDAVDAAEQRKGPLPDREVVALSRALAQPDVRDACLSFAVQTRARAAERLWLELTRSCPSPERAEPACLLAFFAYHRGDGGLASVAIDVAEEACFGHSLARLLRGALSAALPPEELKTLADKAVVNADKLLDTEAQSSSGRSQP